MTTTQSAKKKQTKFKVVSWLDLHGTEVLFVVVDRFGNEWGRFPSEAEAIAAQLAAEKNAA
jgi:hypothetical protein